MNARCLTYALFALVAGCGKKDTTAHAVTGAQQASQENMEIRKIAGSEVSETTLNVGQASVTQSASPAGKYAAVFEDDGDTGWFYALDHSRSGNPIVDALSIYNVQEVADRDQPSQLQIVWSMDGIKAALFINSYPHAIYNFEEMRGYCRSGVGSATSQDSHEWHEAQLEHFYAGE